MVALKWSMHNLYGIEPGEVFWGASDVGWVVGHSYIVYGAAAARLHHRSSTRASRSARPTPAPSGASSPSTGVVALFTAPTAFRAIKKEDPEGELIAALRPLAASARCSSPASAPTPTRCTGRSEQLGVPVIDHWWQTETGWAIAGNPVGLGTLPVKHGSPTVPMPGYDLHVLDEGGKPRAAPDTHGHDRHQAAAAAGLPADPVERRRALPRELPRRLPGLLQDGGRRLHRRGRLRLRHGRAPTTSSTSPATGSRPAAWRRCWPPTRTSPNAP